MAKLFMPNGTPGWGVGGGGDGGSGGGGGGHMHAFICN